MIATLADFEESTAFERLVLAEVFPLLATTNTVAQAALDLRGGGGVTTDGMMLENLGTQARQDLIDRLRPLFFGAAWKILDLLVELGLHLDGLTPKKGPWLISKKKTYARRRRGQCLPWISHQDLWERICDVYASTVEARHALVHRQFLLSSSGDMTDIRDRHGVRKRDVTAGEQEAFARAAQRIAAATLASALSNRERLAIAWLLDQLGAHHGHPPLGGSEARSVEVVRIDAAQTSSGWVVDVNHAKAEVHRVSSDRSFYDIEIHFPGTGWSPITGPLEEVPSGSKVSIDPHAPPSWVW
jgi:hypothetical protein